jgi:transposase
MLRRARRRAFPGDLTDARRAAIPPLIPDPSPGGRARKTSNRGIVEAIVYPRRAGRAWRLPPHDVPPRQTVCCCRRRCRREGFVALEGIPTRRSRCRDAPIGIGCCRPAPPQSLTLRAGAPGRVRTAAPVKGVESFKRTPPAREPGMGRVPAHAYPSLRAGKRNGPMHRRHQNPARFAGRVALRTSRRKRAPGLACRRAAGLDAVPLSSRAADVPLSHG